MALGGQGAPLVPYFDYVYFTDPDETRLLLNLGGIANFTLLPASAAPSDVLAFDTGPANMVIDALTERLFDQPYDPEGSLAAEGTPDNDLLASLLGDAYFTQPPPKSTGREYFGADYVDALLDAARARGLSLHDTLATATMLTATTVYQAYARFVRPEHAADVLIAAGGGLHNDTLMQYLADCFSPIPVRPASDYGLDGDAKEALCFAVLAHETVNGVPTNLPSVTGATRPTLLGTICVPS
jgi:anhydro-N-acetylmuramic acid kinase